MNLSPPTDSARLGTKTMNDPSQVNPTTNRPSDYPNDRTIIGNADDTLAPAGRLGGGHQWIGRKLGRYKLTGLLGGGGMGVVYRAHDETIDRDVAIKVLPPELNGDPTTLARFLAEAKAAGRLSHPNAVAIYEIGEHERTHYLVMELVTGGSLAEEVRRIGPLSPVAATKAVSDAARGLAAAHAAGLVHRDIKPANLIRSADGLVKVCDFGLAKEIFTDHGVTKTGHVVGTPYYMSPEQCLGKPVDARGDVYSLGATYYYLLTGAEPYADAETTMQVMYSHCHGDPLDPRPLNALVPDECASIILKATAKDPDSRYQSAGEMLRDFEAAASHFSGGRSGSQVQLGLSASDRARLSGTEKSRLSGSDPRLITTDSLVTAKPTRSLKWPIIAAIVAVSAISSIMGWQLWNRQSGVPSDKASIAAAGLGSGETEAASIAAAGPAALPIAGEPIRIGTLFSLSGTMADNESPVVDAILLGIEEINAAGGVLGRPLEAVVADGRSDPAVFLREAERLIDVEKVPVVLGCWTSASRKTVVPLFEDRDHLLLYPVQYEGLEESPNVFYFGAAPNQQILPAIKWATDTLAAKRFYIIGSDYVFPRAAGAIIKGAADELGIEIVGEEYLPLASRDVKSSIEAIAAAKPDMILNLINGDTNLAFFPALREAGVDSSKVPTLSFSIDEEGLRRLSVSAVTGDYAAWNYFQAIETAENQSFVKTFRTRYGPQRLITDPMEAAYVSLKLWANAAEEAADLQPRQVRRALLSQRLDAPEGPVRVDPESQHLYKTPRVGQIADDGRFNVVWSAPAPIAPEPYPPSRTVEEWKGFLRDLYTGWGDQWSAPSR